MKTECRTLRFCYINKGKSKHIFADDLTDTKA